MAETACGLGERREWHPTGATRRVRQKNLYQITLSQAVIDTTLPRFCEKITNKIKEMIYGIIKYWIFDVTIKVSEFSVSVFLLSENINLVDLKLTQIHCLS